MGTKNIITIVLMVFVVGSVAFMIFEGLFRDDVVDSEGMGTAEEIGAAEEIGTAEEMEAVQSHRVVAYYFYTTKRCPTCKKIEEYTKESIEANFPRLLESGSLEFHALNVDERENERFIEEYQLTTKSVILVDYRGGERVAWKNLDKVWEYTGDREIFVDYVKDETLGFLAELSGVE
ncbi:MAG: hypothetical protein KAV42_00720 [Candidatus Krumholzibacteria bacterium]|nr:hypothetical protein [Candidatus Krumholzibacteria bacterium]